MRSGLLEGRYRSVAVGMNLLRRWLILVPRFCVGTQRRQDVHFATQDLLGFVSILSV